MPSRKRARPPIRPNTPIMSLSQASPAGIRAGLEEDQPIDFESLRTYGKENKLDYSAYFQPPEGVLNTIFSRLFPFWIKPGIRAGHVKDRDKRNDMVLRTLLRNSQAAIKLGLDLRGG